MLIVAIPITPAVMISNVNTTSLGWCQSVTANKQPIASLVFVNQSSNRISSSKKTCTIFNLTNNSDSLIDLRLHYQQLVIPSPLLDIVKYLPNGDECLGWVF